MAQSYEMANGYILNDEENGLSVANAQGERFNINAKGIFRSTDGHEQMLSADETRKMCQDLLRAEFDLPEDIEIQKTDLKQNSAERFLLVLNAGNAENKTQIELKSQNKTTELNHNSLTTRPIKGGLSKVQLQIRYFTDGLTREYHEDERQKDKVYSDIYEDQDRLHLSRSVKNNGKKLVLSREVYSLSDDGYTDQSKEQTSIEITPTEITEDISTATDKYKKRIKVSYQSKSQTLQIRMKRTDYDDIAITEYKATILTPKTGKKVPVTTFYDREFDAKLTCHADGSFEYEQARSNEEACLEKTKTTQDFTKVHPEMAKVADHVRDLIKKLTVLANANRNGSYVDFSQNPSTFDNEIDFAAVKDEAFVKLGDTLSQPNLTAHQRLLAALVRFSDSSLLTQTLQNKQYS